MYTIFFLPNLSSNDPTKRGLTTPPKKIKEVEKQNKALVAENKHLRSRIKTGECDTSEFCDEQRAGLDGLSTELKKLKLKLVSA